MEWPLWGSLEERGGNGSIREGGKEKEEKGLAAMKNSLGEPERSIHQRMPLNTKCNNVFFCVRHLFFVWEIWIFLFVWQISPPFLLLASWIREWTFTPPFWSTVVCFLSRDRQSFITRRGWLCQQGTQKLSRPPACNDVQQQSREYTISRSLAKRTKAGGKCNGDSVDVRKAIRVFFGGGMGVGCTFLPLLYRDFLIPLLLLSNKGRMIKADDIILARYRRFGIGSLFWNSRNENGSGEKKSVSKMGSMAPIPSFFLLCLFSAVQIMTDVERRRRKGNGGEEGQEVAQPAAQ